MNVKWVNPVKVWNCELMQIYGIAIWTSDILKNLECLIGRFKAVDTGIWPNGFKSKQWSPRVCTNIKNEWNIIYPWRKQRIEVPFLKVVIISFVCSFIPSILQRFSGHCSLESVEFSIYYSARYLVWDHGNNRAIIRLFLTRYDPHLASLFDDKRRQITANIQFDDTK